jgi:hypothetical protein
MRGKIAIAAVIGALALGGTAVAAGGPGGMFGADHEQELAADLAEQLKGVNANQVEDALETVAEEQQAEQRAGMAEGIAAELGGVSADRVENALAEHEERMKAAVESGERPGRDSLVATLASGLDRSENEIRAALESSREAVMEEHQAAALERLDAAVESGDITEEQADKIRERIESGEGPGGPGHHGPGGPGFGPGGPGFGGPDGALPPADGQSGRDSGSGA